MYINSISGIRFLSRFGYGCMILALLGILANKYVVVLPLTIIGLFSLVGSTILQARLKSSRAEKESCRKRNFLKIRDLGREK